MFWLVILQLILLDVQGVTPYCLQITYYLLSPAHTTTAEAISLEWVRLTDQVV